MIDLATAHDARSSAALVPRCDAEMACVYDPRTIKYFESLGLPGWFAYVTITAELGGAACLLLGIYPRYVALLLVPLMLGTIIKVHGKNGWLFSNKDGAGNTPRSGPRHW